MFMLSTGYSFKFICFHFVFDWEDGILKYSFIIGEYYFTFLLYFCFIVNFWKNVTFKEFC